MENSIAYMEPPYWYYPVRQTLGAVLYQQGRYAKSAAMFREALAKLPKNGWALWGLMQAEAKAGDANLAADHPPVRGGVARRKVAARDRPALTGGR